MTNTQTCAIAALFAMVTLELSAVAQAKPLKIASPDGQVVITVAGGERLRYAVTRGGTTVIEQSPLGLVVDGADLGRSAVLGKAASYSVNDSYPTRGVHSAARTRCNGREIAVHSVTDYTIDVRACDDGIAFRTIVQGAPAASRVPDEASAFTLPKGSTVWVHDFHMHYEGRHTKKAVEEVAAGSWIAPPLTFKLPNGGGYGSISEAALVNFSGMGLEAAGNNSFAARLGHAEPPSYPYTLRFGDAEAKRLSQPAAITGTITTPWRVILVASTLDALVNSDLITSLNPPPDPKVFAEGLGAAWLKPGRATWRYIDDQRPNTLEVQKEYADRAHDMGFEYMVVEGAWQRWQPGELKQLIDYARERNVGVWLWKHSRDLHDAAVRHEFFRMCHDMGVAGVKLDFFDHEHKELIDLYNAIYRETAEQHLLVNFHGSNKPTGENRTWPNELTREAVAGMESRGPRAVHDTTLPFTRFLAGPADYTPVNFGPRRGDTTLAHQIATGIVFTSPLLTYGLDPNALLASPAVDVIKAIPADWDETRVLPGSEIGEVAMFARRKGGTWFIGVLNGEGERNLLVPLDFLGKGDHKARFVRDADNDSLQLEQATINKKKTKLAMTLRSGGGFVAVIAK
jgi:alpha-glucosidase